MNVDEIISGLSTLNQKDLKKVRAALDHLIGPKDRYIHDGFDQYFYVVAKSLNYSRYGYTAFAKTKAFQQWKRNMASVVSFLDDHFKNAPKVSKLAIFQMLVEELKNDLKNRGVPVTLGTLANNIGRLPEVFDSCFPAYTFNNLAHFVLKAMKKKGET